MARLCKILGMIKKRNEIFLFFIILFGLYPDLCIRTITGRIRLNEDQGII